MSAHAIARAAQTGPGLARHFGSEERLFLETVQLRDDPRPLLDVPVEHLGTHLVEVLLSPAGSTREVFLALVRGSDQRAVAARLRESHEHLG